MQAYNIQIIGRAEELPPMQEGSFFHSRQLFELADATPRMRPYMVVALLPDGTVSAHMLAIIRSRASFFPPFFYRHCRILGEGEYAEASSEVFGQMISALSHFLRHRVLYIEVSNLSRKMFGYREFKRLQFFPIHWMSIHNSLHSHTPEERISNNLQHRIDNAYMRGAITKEVENEQEFQAFSRLLRHHHWLKPKRYIPADDFFKGIRANNLGRLYVTTFHERVVGCSAVVYSGNNAYLWFSAFRRKSFAIVHPDILTIWHTLKDTYRQGYDHLFFLDVGLPFSKNPYREFILRFGGKPTSTYRWFHCNLSWVNKFLSWIYRD